jgi:hypothetical protein
MAVNQLLIENSIKQLLIDMRSKDDTTIAINYYSSQLAKIIKDAILSAQVQSGIPVATAGTATNQTGATTATGSLI